MDRASRSIDIVDEIDGGGHDVRLAFHLGPDVEVELTGCARDPGLAWRIHAGSGATGRCRRNYGGACTEVRRTPILGWYSRGLGQRVPTFMFLGQGQCAPGAPLRTRLEFLDVGKRNDLALSDRPHTRRNGCGRHKRYHRCLLGPHMYSTMTAIPVWVRHESRLLGCPRNKTAGTNACCD